MGNPVELEVSVSYFYFSCVEKKILMTIGRPDTVDLTNYFYEPYLSDPLRFVYYYYYFEIKYKELK